MTPETLLIMYPGCTAFELYAVAELLHRHLPVRLATPDGSPIEGGNGLRHDADFDFDSVDVDRHAVVAVAGGDIESVYENDALFELIREAEGSGAVVGGICNGAWLLARAGVLEGRRCTHTCRAERGAPAELLEVAGPDFEGSSYLDEDVVIDSQIVTAVPWAYVEFAAALGRSAGVLSTESSERLAAYYRGLPLSGSP